MATDETKGEDEWPSERAAYELIEMVGMVRAHPAPPSVLRRVCTTFRAHVARRQSLPHGCAN